MKFFGMDLRIQRVLPFCFVILQSVIVRGEYGFLRVKAFNYQYVEFCTAFNSQFSPFPHTSTAPWARWSNVYDSYNDLGCTKMSENFKNSVVILKRGNCTFAQKGLHVQQAKGNGVLIVNDGELVIPGISANEENLVNISVSVISKDSYDKIMSYEEKYGKNNIRVWQYQPEVKSKVDPNAIVMWLLAVCTCAVGGWLQGQTGQNKEVKCNSASSTDRENSKENADGGDVELHITTTHAVVFFFMCSISILLMYYFFNYLVYVLIGMFCYASTVALFDMLYRTFKYSPCFSRFRVNLMPICSQRPPVLGILLFVLCAIFGITWAVLRKASYAWIMQDVLGISFCIYMIKTIRLPSFKVCVLLLILFFVYDVFYVFVTPFLTSNHESVMVHVATGGDGKTKEEIPMLFKLPKFILSPLAKCVDMPYSMLGFGDVILPGLHVGFCASWDAKISNTVKFHTYFLSAICGYGIGLIITFIAMYVMMMGQPALLYLVPCCLLSTLIVALHRKELNTIWHAPKTLPKSHPTETVWQNAEEEDSLLKTNNDL